MTLNTNTRPVWAARTITLDPYALPQHVEFQDDARTVSVTVDRTGAVMLRELSCGVDVKVALPSQNFEGVAARMWDDENGSHFALELHHRDPALCVPLLVTSDATHAVETWRSWARMLRLSMVMVEADGSLTPVDMQGSVTMFDPQPRRRRHTAVKRRPVFLRRRKSGTVAPARRIEAREIIARN